MRCDLREFVPVIYGLMWGRQQRQREFFSFFLFFFPFLAILDIIMIYPCVHSFVIFSLQKEKKRKRKRKEGRTHKYTHEKYIFFLLLHLPPLYRFVMALHGLYSTNAIRCEEEDIVRNYIFKIRGWNGWKKRTNVHILEGRFELVFIRVVT